MDIKSSSVLGVCLIIAALIVALAPRPQSSGPASGLSPVQAVRSPEGRLVVTFSVTTSRTQGSEAWQSGDIEGVTAIEFHPGFVVVQTREGAGTVFFPDKTKGLNWKLKKGE